MLSLFPQLLFLAPLTYTLLRVAAGSVFLYLAYRHYKSLSEVEREIALITGSLARIICSIYIIIEIGIALALIAGAWTQLAALIGCIIALKALIIRRSLHAIAPLSRSSYILLAVICLSLVFTGAGAFAFDLPL